MKTLFCSIILAVLMISSSAYSIPEFLSHQGHIIDSDGTPVSGSVNATFELFANPVGGSALWSETISVTFDGGYFSVILGTTESLSSDIVDGSNLYLSLTIAGQDPFVPRHPIVAVPYAFYAGAVDGPVHARGGLFVDNQEIINDSGDLATANITTENINATDSLTLPVGNLSDLPSASESNRGQLYFASDQGKIYYSDGSQWQAVGQGSGNGSDLQAPNIISLSPNQIVPGLNETIIINGSAFEDNCQVQFGEVYSPSVSFVNEGEVDVLSTELESGVYDVILSNPVGLRGFLAGGLVVDDIPEWVTEAGNLGFVINDSSGEHFTLEGTDPEGQDLSFTLSAGALPTGLSLDENSGIISGDPDDVSEDTDFVFTITMADSARTPNTVDREFSITVSDRLGQDSGSPGLTCKHILETGSTVGDGVYWVDPNDGSTGDSYQTYCDMTTDGGGWTLVAYAGDNGAGFPRMDTNVGSFNPTSRSGKASKSSVDVVHRSTEMSLAYHPTVNHSGSMAETTDAVAFVIPNPSIVDFATSGNNGTCEAVSARRLKPDGSNHVCVGDQNNSIVYVSADDCNPNNGHAHAGLWSKSLGGTYSGNFAYGLYQTEYTCNSWNNISHHWWVDVAYNNWEPSATQYWSGSVNGATSVWLR